MIKMNDNEKCKNCPHPKSEHKENVGCRHEWSQYINEAGRYCSCEEFTPIKEKMKKGDVIKLDPDKKTDGIIIEVFERYKGCKAGIAELSRQMAKNEELAWDYVKLFYPDTKEMHLTYSHREHEIEVLTTEENFQKSRLDETKFRKSLFRRKLFEEDGE
jgi:hypothetical protein